MKKKRYLIIGLLIFLIIDATLILTNNISWFDNFIYNIVINLKSDFMTNVMKGITFLGSVKFIIIINVLLFIYSMVKKKYNLLLITISSITSPIVNNILKVIFKRPRPIIINMIEERSYSFPSGHSMISILFYGSIIYLLNKYKIKHCKLISIILSMLILLIGISRIYLGVHYPSDVLGGYLTAGICLTIITLIYKKKCKE